MSLKQQISDDMKSAMRSKDAEKLSVIRMLLAAMKQIEVDERVELDDSRIIGVITKMIKQRQDSEKIYREAGRIDLADKEANEIKTLNIYLPAQLSETEIVQAIQEAVKQVNASGMADMGKVMSILRSQLTGQADMSKVSQLLKASLQSL